MYINQVDDLFDGILNNFYDYLEKEQVFKKLNSDANFVMFQMDILNYIKKFIEKIPKKDIIGIIKNESYYDNILNIIKRYCAFYIYLGIGYYYTEGRDLFITNMIEAGKYQKDATFQIENFFNSENNSKIITFFNDIDNFKSLLQFGTVDKIKIKLENNPLKYQSTIKLFNELGEDYIIEYFLIKNNFHNMMKALIFRQIYLKEEKNEIIEMLNQQEKDNAEYKYIEIVISNEKKIVDFNVIQKFLTMEQLKSGMAEEIYNYLQDMRETKEIILRENQDFIKYLFSNQILIPITEEFIRYHKDTEKYDPESLTQMDPNVKQRDATKIKYVINKINNIKNYYSEAYEKNPKLKLDVEKEFYKQLDPRMATLYNDNEEVNIINKLKMSDNASDKDLLIDLENIRKYAYINFKNFSKDGIKLRTPKTVKCIRYSNLKNKNNSPIETRIGHDNIDYNVVGVAWNPSGKAIDCMSTNDLINVKKITDEENGYKAFIKVMNSTFNNPDKNVKLFYWLFDNNKDKTDAKGYLNYSVNDVAKNIMINMELVYYNYIDLVKNKMSKHLDNTKKTSVWNFYNLMKFYEKKYFDFTLMPSIKNELTEKALIDSIPELEVVPDDIDSMIPGKREKLIELPIYQAPKEKVKVIKLGEKEVDYSLELVNKTIPVCLHYIKWKNIARMAKKSEDFNQLVFEFVKQYVKLGDHGDYVCKSCNEGVPLHKYNFEGTYVEELDTFLTTSLAVNQKLEEIPKYSKFIRTIRNIEKNIERFAYSVNLFPYIGNTPVIKLKRKMIIKDVIDLILLHKVWLEKQPDNRIEIYNKMYNTSLSTLFFFELEDKIFLTSSTDTDKYKEIKYNNIMAYLILIMITEINSGQILNLKEDLKLNFYVFKRGFLERFIGDLRIKKNQKEAIPIAKIPLFAYILYYFSNVMVNNRLWLWKDTEEGKDKQTVLFEMQTKIIHTVVDLINTVVDANFEPNKNFFYEIINARFSAKLLNTYNDQQLLKRVEENAMKHIKIEEGTNKIKYVRDKIILIELNNPFNPMETIHSKCESKINQINILPIEQENNYVSILTNCDDGKFHQWQFKNNDLICARCGKLYSETVKKLQTTTSEKPNMEYFDKLKLISLRKLSRKYCITSELHDFNDKNICIKCNYELDVTELTDKNLLLLEKNINKKQNDEVLKQINIIKQYNENILKKKEKSKKIINKLFKKFEKLADNKIENYIIEFINKLVKILGQRIKFDNKTIYLKDNVYILDHDYLGNDLKQSVNILTSDDKIQFASKHPAVGKDVIYYKDNANKVYVYYDSITMQYLGYSEDNRTLKKNKNVASLKIDLSIKDCLTYLGYENQYYNILHTNKDYQYELPEKFDNKNKDVILSIIRTRMGNLKQIISRVQTIIYNISNSGNINSNYNFEEKSIVNEFTKKLRKFNMKNKEGHKNIFKNYTHIVHNLPVNHNLPDNIIFNLNKNYLNVNKINNLNNSDNKLVFYLLYNFNLLLEYNEQPAIQTELAHMIIKIIQFVFNIHYRPYYDYNIRKFDFLLINEDDTPYIDETLKVAGHYQELLTQEEIDDPARKEAEYDANEAFDSLDIDDYEQDDDIDGSAEALDGFE